MTEQHPITPPPELVEDWAHMLVMDTDSYVFTQAARWGADQQLEQDAKWLDTNALFSSHLTITPSGDALRQVMRPKTPSLKQQALCQLDILDNKSNLQCNLAVIRRVIESMPE